MVKLGTKFKEIFGNWFEVTDVDDTGIWATEITGECPGGVCFFRQETVEMLIDYHEDIC